MKRRATHEGSVRVARLPGLIRARDLEEREVPRGRLQGMLRRGEIQRVARGLYRLRDAPLTELETIAAVSKRIPNAIVCLLTALHVHSIGTQAPRDVWIALDRKARKPARLPARVRIVRFSGAMLTYGIQTRPMLGVPVSITSPARTIVDCFRYRNKVGIDVVMEALRDAVRSRITTVDKISRAAEMCRIRTVIGPYLEALSA